jgi:hypothetical protein
VWNAHYRPDSVERNHRTINGEGVYIRKLRGLSTHSFPFVENRAGTLYSGTVYRYLNLTGGSCIFKIFL